MQYNVFYKLNVFDRMFKKFFNMVEVLNLISTYHWPVLYSFSLCCTEDIALWTDWRFTLLLILAAVPISSVNILLTMDNWPFCGMINDIMLVPLLQKDTFHHSPLITCLVVVNTKYVNMAILKLLLHWFLKILLVSQKKLRKQFLLF